MSTRSDWEQSAPYWGRHHGLLRAMFGAITEAMIEDADLHDGAHVLDVAGGSGEPTLTVAPQVTRVVHTDAVLGMVEAARLHSREGGHLNVEHVHTPAETLPFDDGSFDRVLCRLGLMFFDDPHRGLREMLRVLHPDGILCVATWDDKDRNPFFEVPLQALAPYVDAADAFRSGALRFDDPAAVERLLTEAGAASVKSRTVAFTMRGPLDFDDWWTMRVEMSSTMRAQMPRLTQAQADAVREDVRARTAAWFHKDGFHIPASAIIASGRRTA